MRRRDPARQKAPVSVAMKLNLSGQVLEELEGDFSGGGERYGVSFLQGDGPVGGNGFNVDQSRVGKGFIGPQGEYYPELPKMEQLKVMYGK